ncbi:MAG: AraC family transcriptional regulator, partial [Clostridiales bacterium]|nr:AraC family transcriptional regulator [Clostridiales bacterium]
HLPTGARCTPAADWRASIGGESYIASFHELAKSKLRIVFYIPEAHVMKSLAQFQGVLQAAILAIAVFGVLLAWLLTRRQYAPLGRLLRQFFPEGAPLKNDEYALIAQKVEETRQQNEQFLEEIRSQSARIVNDALLSLLTLSHTMSAQDIGVLLGMCGLSFPEPRFHVLFVKNCELCAGDEPFGAAAAVCRLSSADIALIVNDRPEKRDMLAELRAALQALCGRQPQTLVGISSATFSIGSLSVRFHEATVAASMRACAGENTLITFEDAAQSAASIYYPMDKEAQVMAALHESDYERCRALLAEVRAENEDRRRISPVMMRYLYQAFISTAYRVYDSLQLEDKSPLSTALKALGPSVGSNALFEDILDMYRLTCDLIRKSHDMKSLRFVNHVVRYIQEHSDDPSLSLDAIAKKFEVSYYYLSHMFNEATGQSFTDILNKSRVKRAVSFLSETGDTIQAVAEKAGFTNLTTFLRAFRKETGTTPSGYRKLAKSRQC